MEFTNVFYRLINNLDSRYQIYYGGSSSSKSFSILQYIYLYALKHPKKRISIGAESTPVLKKTVIADFKDHITGDSWNDKFYNKSEMTYTLPNRSVIQFVPCDDHLRWKGMRQHVTYFDEVNHISEEVYKQADIRTSERLFSSFNPTARFWLADSFEDKNTYVDHSTYLDNPYLSDTIVDALKKRIGKDKNFTDVYLYGKWGSLEGLIFNEQLDWDIVEEFPDTYNDRLLGLDFGFTHPTAIVDVRLVGDVIYLKEVLYRSRLTNDAIAAYIDYQVVADSAEPKSITEIRKFGKSIIPAKKGQDSVISGIRLMKQYKLHIHSSSVNLIRELRNYKWMEDRDGKPIDKPVKAFDDAIDAARYAVDGLLNKRNVFVK